MPAPGVGKSGVGELETVVAQLYIAFGQGAGSLYVSPEAIAAGRRQYEQLVAKNLEKWPQASLKALEYARAIGRVAAHLAVSEGWNTIQGDHYTSAAEMVRKNCHVEFCPFLK